MTTQDNLNIVVGFDTEMTVQTPPPPSPPQKLISEHQGPQINIFGITECLNNFPKKSAS